MNARVSLFVVNLMLLAAVSTSRSDAQSPFDQVERALGQLSQSLAPRSLDPVLIQAGSLRSGDYHPGWGIEFRPVPALLRLHCPLVRSGRGLLIFRVDRDGPSSAFCDLRPGDVLLSVDGEEMVDLASLPESPIGELLVMRAGEATTLEVGRSRRPAAQTFPDQSDVNRRWRHANSAENGVSASAFATGGESVAVAQDGEQITLEMSLPRLESAPIRFRGTREEILQQLRTSSLSPAAKQRVRQSLP